MYAPPYIWLDIVPSYKPELHTREEQEQEQGKDSRIKSTSFPED